MKKLLFSALIICSLTNAMCPQKLLVERIDGQKLGASELQYLSVLNSSQNVLSIGNDILWAPDRERSEEGDIEIKKRIKQKKAILVTIIQPQYQQELQRKQNYRLSSYAHDLNWLLEKEKKGTNCCDQLDNWLNDNCGCDTDVCCLACLTCSLGPTFFCLLSVIPVIFRCNDIKES